MNECFNLIYFDKLTEARSRKRGIMVPVPTERNNGDGMTD